VPAAQGQARQVRPSHGASQLTLAYCQHSAFESYTSIYNYNADAGGGSQTTSGLGKSCGWRAFLLGTVAGGALLLSTPWPAKAGPGACTNVAPTATCQGDQSAGIASGAAAPPADFPDTFTTLHVNNLTTIITPGANVDGIYFHGTTNVTINSGTGPFSIFTTGSDAHGIDAAGSSVTITHIGDIGSDSIGFNADAICMKVPLFPIYQAASPSPLSLD
jgi:hypothetical protein